MYILEGIMSKLCNSISDFKNKFSLVQDSIYIVIIIPLNSNFGNINGYKQGNLYEIAVRYFANNIKFLVSQVLSDILY